MKNISTAISSFKYSLFCKTKTDSIKIESLFHSKAFINQPVYCIYSLLRKTKFS